MWPRVEGKDPGAGTGTLAAVSLLAVFLLAGSLATVAIETAQRAAFCLHHCN